MHLLINTRNMLEVIVNPEDSEYQDMVDWLIGDSEDEDTAELAIKEVDPKLSSTLRHSTLRRSTVL